MTRTKTLALLILLLAGAAFWLARNQKTTPTLPDSSRGPTSGIDYANLKEGDVVPGTQDRLLRFSTNDLGLSFLYPEGWQVISSKANSFGLLVAGTSPNPTAEVQYCLAFELDSELTKLVRGGTLYDAIDQAGIGTGYFEFSRTGDFEFARSTQKGLGEPSVYVKTKKGIILFNNFCDTAPHEVIYNTIQTP